MYDYSVYGLVVRTNLPLPHLGPATALEADLHIMLGQLPDSVRQFSLSSSPWYASQYLNEAGESALRIFRLTDGSFFFVYDDGVSLVIDPDGLNVWCRWPANQTLEDTAVYLLGPVMGFVLHLRGHVILHASAVKVGGRAVALAGSAGAGKSTTAAALARRGFPVLTEDVLMVKPTTEGIIAAPGYPLVRLWPSSVELLYGNREALPLITPTWDKRYLSVSPETQDFHPEPLPLGAIYILKDREDSPTAPRIVQFTPANALLHLVGNTYVGHLLDAEQRKKEFTLLSQLMRDVPIRGIVAHADGSRLGELCDLLVRDVHANRTLVQ